MARSGNSRLLRWGAVGATAVLALSACGDDMDATTDGTGGLAAMDPVTLTLQTWLPKGADDANVMDAFAAEVESASDGKITFDIYYAGALLDPAEHFQAVSEGRLDVAKVATPYNPQELPIANAYGRLGTLSSRSYPLGMLESVAAQAESYATDSNLREEFEGAGLTPLFAGQASMGFDLLCSEEISSVADLKGKRVRTPGTVWAEQAEALGMTGVSIASSEQYEALQRGVLDCVIGRTATLDVRDLWDVATYFVPNVFAASPAGTVWVINTDRLESMPEGAQQIIKDSARMLLESEIKETIAADRLVAEQADGKGVKVIDPAPFIEALAEHDAGMVEGVGEALPDSVSDAEAWAQARVDLNTKWHDFLVGEVALEERPTNAMTYWSDMLSLDEAKVDAFIDQVADVLW